MISILHYMNSLLRLTAFNLIGIVLLAITLCVVFPFFLVIVIIGTTSGAAYALGRRWSERRGRHYGARRREN